MCVKEVRESCIGFFQRQLKNFAQGQYVDQGYNLERAQRELQEMMEQLRDSKSMEEEERRGLKQKIAAWQHKVSKMQEQVLTVTIPQCMKSMLAEEEEEKFPVFNVSSRLYNKTTVFVFIFVVFLTNIIQT